MDGPYPQVYALAIYGGQLIVGGDFTFVDGIPMHHVARWDGVAWHPMGNGLSHGVYAMAIYNGELIAAAGGIATFKGTPVTGLAQWDGRSWHQLGKELTGVPRALAVYQGNLIVGGSFMTADGLIVYHIAQWDGSSWSALEDGIRGFIDQFQNAGVYALAVHEGELIAGGSFSTAGGKAISNIARWNGSEWNPMSCGVTGIVRTLTSHDGVLNVGGELWEAGGIPSIHWAQWGCPQSLIFADISPDGVVNGIDLAVLLAGWGTCESSAPSCGEYPCQSDLNQDGVVNGLDLGLFAGRMGLAPAQRGP